MRKGKDPEPDPDLELDLDSYLWLMDLDPGGPKYVDSADPDPQHCSLVPVLDLKRYTDTQNTRPENEA